ncbi:MAG: hypothetical protein HYW78_01705 [Parcubacteria group bacterium]|nr:hypothetical protein [Parcubacteria group bacterium]
MKNMNGIQVIVTCSGAAILLGVFGAGTIASLIGGVIIGVGLNYWISKNRNKK